MRACMCILITLILFLISPNVQASNEFRLNIF